MRFGMSQATTMATRGASGKECMPFCGEVCTAIPNMTAPDMRRSRKQPPRLVMCSCEKVVAPDTARKACGDVPVIRMPGGTA